MHHFYFGNVLLLIFPMSHVIRNAHSNPGTAVDQDHQIHPASNVQSLDLDFVAEVGYSLR